MRRDEALRRIAARLMQRRAGRRRLRVAIDGRDAAGKTTLADELADVLRIEGVPVVRAGVDGWHHPRAVRYRRGADSGEGYYRDSFDYPALRRLLLDPLGPDGDGRYVSAIHDWRRGTAFLDPRAETAPEGAVLLFDGVFLMRPELEGCWECTIHVAVDEAVAMDRAVRRDARWIGGDEQAQARYRSRYAPGQVLYWEQACPEARADIVLDNTDAREPRLRRLS